MKLLLIVIAALLPFVADADVGYSSSRSSDCEEVSVIERRVPLATNTPAVLYEEFQRSLDGLTFDAKHAFGASIIFGGNDDGFAVAIMFAGSPAAQREAFINRIAAYAKLRWLGISPKSALSFATTTEEKNPENIPDKHAKIIREASPGIPISALRPLTTGPLVSMPWLGTEPGAYILIDDEVSIIFQPYESTAGAVCPPPYIIDSAEFSPAIAPRIRSIAEQVHKRLAGSSKSNPPPASTYWHELKQELQRAGLQWHSPAELTSNHVWE